MQIMGGRLARGSSYSVRAVAGVLCILASAWYLVLLTDGTLDLWHPTPLGRVYADMAWRLLHYDFTIDPVAIDREAFLRDGKAYSYFGIFPALFRMPFAVIGLPIPPLARLSCWVALSIAAYLQMSMLLAAYARGPRTDQARLVFLAALIALLFTGPQLGLTFSAWIYNEPIVWGVVLNLLFVRIVLLRVLQEREPAPRDWAVLGFLCGLAFLTRPTDAVGMTIGLGCLAIYFPVGAAIRDRVPPGLAAIAILRNGCCAALPFMPLFLLTLFINWQRWGTPLEFMPMGLSTLTLEDPRRMRVYKQYGSFELLHAPIAIIYYFFGMIGRAHFADLIDRIFDEIAWPRSAFVVTSTALLVLATLGLLATLRTRPGYDRGAAIALMVGPAISAGLLLLLAYLHYRYRYGFVPFFALCGVLGSMALAGRDDRRGRLLALGVVALAIVNVAVSHVDLLQAKFASFALSDEERAALASRVGGIASLFYKGP